MICQGGEPQKLMQLDTEGLANVSVHPDGQRIAFTATGRGEDGTWAIENFLPKTSSE